MKTENMLIEAQMHLECINEAFGEMGPSIAQLVKMDGMEPFSTAWHEANARLWAAIHLIQSVSLGRPDVQLPDALREANAFNRDGEASPPCGH